MPSRPVHPYSVVFEGLSGPEEMAAAIKEDKVVSEHYAGLIPARFRAEKLQADRQGYVSYRVRDKIFWTKRMMTLKKGEMVLTDGSTMLRGRCGNLVSASPMEPVAAPGSEPEEAVLDSFQESRLLAGIPPVPESSPVDGELILTRYPKISSAGSLLISPGSSYGLIVPQAGIGSSNAAIVFLGGVGGGVGGGGSTFSPSYPSPGGNPPLTPGGPWTPLSVPPSLIAYVPPALTPVLPPTGPYGPPQPYIPSTPNFTVPPTPVPPPGVQPPPAPPPIFVPPTVFPPNSPPLTPPDQPPGTPPTLPPGTGTPPLASPPPVLDPPPPPDTSVPEPRTFFLVAGALAAYGASRYLAKR